MLKYTWGVDKKTAGKHKCRRHPFLSRFVVQWKLSVDVRSNNKNCAKVEVTPPQTECR